MPSPFPGMDPYLERPGIWQQVHADLIVDIRRFLAPRLRPRYHVAIEQHTYLSLLPAPENRVGIPDVVVTEHKPGAAPVITATMPAVAVEPVVAELPQLEEVKHRYLEIRDTESQTVITTIEILSPGNKVGRHGREQYEEKRLKLLSTMTNLVEIDLLRSGDPLPMRVPYQNDYRIVVSRSYQRPRADAYLFGVRDAIPDFPIPLRKDEDEPQLPLNQLLHDLYDKGSYDLMVDYQQPPTPPLAETHQEWVETILAKSDE